MGIDQRRARERAQRKQDILAAAWAVAEETSWVTFSVERVAAAAELGRATVYAYFTSLAALVLAMAEDALERLNTRLEDADRLEAALDVPVRYAQSDPAAFALLFPPGDDPRPQFSTPELANVRSHARARMAELHRKAADAGADLPDDARSAGAFVAGIAMAGAVIPELRKDTPLRRRWQEFCLKASGPPPRSD